MISRYEAIIDGNPLSHIHPSIIVHDIEHRPSDISYTTALRGNLRGSVVTSEAQEGSSVTIYFELHIYSILERQRILQEVQKWASGSVLETNDRVGQQLYIRCTRFPRIESAMRWTEPLTVEFTAFEIPFWQEKQPAVLTLTGASDTGTLFVPGNIWNSYVEITATPTGTLNTLTLTVGDTEISFTDLGATASNPLTITYNDKLIQSIKVGTTSALSKRTAASSDDLLAKCGEVTDFGITAGVSTAVEFRAKGMWL